MVKKNSTGLFLMAMMYANPFRIKDSNPPGADENVVNPPQSEESKQYFLKKAEEKRLRKRLKQQKLLENRNQSLKSDEF